MQIGEYVTCAARLHPEREVAVFGEQRISYGVLEREVDRCARALLAAGIVCGDRVAILSTPRPEYLVVFLATLRIGAISIGLNPVHQFEEYRYVLDDCRPRILFGFSQLRGRDNRECLRWLANEIQSQDGLVVFDDTRGIGVPYERFAATAGRIADHEAEAAMHRVEPDCVAMVVHTSGSTGRAKGAMITQRNISHCATVQRGLFPVEPLRILCNLPINHTACGCDIVSYALVSGGTIVFQERFDPAAALRAVEQERITCLIQVPAMYQRMLAEPRLKSFDTSSLRAVFFLGSPMPRDLIIRLKTLGGEVITGWGLTEATSSVTYTDPLDDIDVVAETVGRPAPSFDVRIVDPEGNTLGDGEVGEVLVRGACVMAGYYRQPQATSRAIDAAGWLRSGDLGTFDESGRLRIVGRIKEMFKSGGYNIYPREIEKVLESHPSVALAAVVAAPHELYYEVGCAFLIGAPGCQPTELEIAEFCRQRLANYKIPKAFIVRDALPMLAIGKIDKTALREEARRRFGAPAAS